MLVVPRGHNVLMSQNYKHIYTKMFERERERKKCH